MRTSIICLWIMMILAVSCTRSRFATTTRQYRDGKAVYTNHYAREARNFHLKKARPLATPGRDESVKTAVNPVDSQATPAPMNLIASSDNGILVHTIIENLVGPNLNTANPGFHYEKVVTPAQQPRPALTKKAGKALFKEMNRAGDTTVKKGDSIKEKPVKPARQGGPKTEKLGLVGFILSLLGLIPVFGIPFALLAVIFGANSLKKINRNPERYKGKGFALASLTLGCTMLLVNIILLIVSITESAKSTPAPHLNTSSTTCKV